ncbi:FtsJ-like methyltransferase-domain-containing protein [Xylaria sp. CBS 124048]|nr:FtsJ-like methyltransferase-domain-containing protein [Xylaria sp. CBS 124048]
MRALASFTASPKRGLVRIGVFATSQITSSSPLPRKSSSSSSSISISNSNSSTNSNYGIRWSSSSSRWKERQEKDLYAREAKMQGLKSRAAFKLLEMDAKYKLFKKGQTVVDLGYAPGSWSQVAVERTKPNGRVIGIDLIPAQPPKGVSTIQGDFLSPFVQTVLKDYLVEFAQPRTKAQQEAEELEDGALITDKPSYIDTERADSVEHDPESKTDDGKLVDVIISDMSEPWQPITGFSSWTLSNPYRRMMNTSGNKFRDHVGSMELCLAALKFANETLRVGGHFVCKFYQGSEDAELEWKLKQLFAKVHREKPESSRSESRESFFVALRRKRNATL